MTDQLSAGDTGAPAAAVPAVPAAAQITAQTAGYSPVAAIAPVEPVEPAAALEGFEATAGSPAPPQNRSRWQRAYLGRPQDPLWARPTLLAILALSAAMYLWNVSASGYANEFYAAAVQSGTKSWSAMFFGSLDSGNFITVDKPPFALWVMEVSTRIFGFSGPAMLAPIALCGVASVGVLYSAVRRSFGHGAAAVAALVAALTPITVAINRDDNPDPVLVLLMTLGARFTLEAMRTKRLRHLLWAAVMIGCAFNTKMLQAYIVLPALVLVYLFAAEGGFWKRIKHLSLFTVVLAAASFWWMLIVDAIPEGSRPYIGGSTNDSVWDLVIGYNGLGRITGSEGGPGGGGGASFSGTAGLGRLFNDILGTQISWLLPAAAILGVAALVLRGRAPRNDPARAALLLWGLWLGVHFIVFSYQQGTMHPYYVTTMGPAIGALIGGGGSLVWQRIHTAGGHAWAWLVLPVTVGVSAVWSITLLNRTSYATWLVPVIAVAAVVAVATLIALRLQPQHRVRLGAIGLGALLVAGLAGPTAFAAAAANSTVNGTNPTAGPSSGMGGPGGAGGFGGGQRGGASDGGFGGAPGGTGSQSGQSGAPSFGGTPGGTGGPSGQTGQTGQLPSFGDGQGGFGGQQGEAGTTGGGAIGGGGGGMDAGLSSAELSYLEANQGSAKWLVAVTSSNSAASIELQSGRAAISMFGFTGSDPAMTVAKLQKLVSSGELKYVLLGGGMGGGMGGGTSSSSVQTWVQQNCTAVPASAYGGTSSTTTTTTTSTASGLYACTASSVSSSSTTA